MQLLTFCRWRCAFFTQKCNAHNIPQARPIETFWALCKPEYRKRLKQPKNLIGFRQIWRNVSKKVSREHGKNLMHNVCKNIRCKMVMQALWHQLRTPQYIIYYVQVKYHLFVIIFFKLFDFKICGPIYGTRFILILWNSTIRKVITTNNWII